MKKFFSKRSWIELLILFIGLGWALKQGKLPFSKNSPSPTVIQGKGESWAPCFTPGGNCTDQLVQAIDKTKETVLVQAYSFTSAPIAQALVKAKKRGIEVKVILDKSQKSEKYSSADFLVRQGISVFIDDEHAIAHNKVMILDGTEVVTGSFNFTKSAQERNAENLLIINSPELAKKYTENWKKHSEHSGQY